MADGYGSLSRKALLAMIERQGSNEVPKVIEALWELGHEVYEDGQINTVGVRSSNDKADSFDDEMHLAWVGKDKLWHWRWYPCTTDPGLYFLQNPIKPLEGTAILCPGQYRAYTLAKHRGIYTTLCQRAGRVKVWRDRNMDSILDHYGKPESGWFGVNLHHSGDWEKTKVGRASAGCQVLQNIDNWREALQIWRESGAEVFTYTLINDRDLPS